MLSPEELGEGRSQLSKVHSSVHHLIERFKTAPAQPRDLREPVESLIWWTKKKEERNGDGNRNRNGDGDGLPWAKAVDNLEKQRAGTALLELILEKKRNSDQVMKKNHGREACSLSEGSIVKRGQKFSAQSKRIRVFWDIENVSVPSDREPFSLVQVLQAKLVELAKEAWPETEGEPPIRIHCFHNPARRTLSKGLRKSLVSAFVTLVDIGKEKTGAADLLIVQELGHIAEDYDPAEVLTVLISSDTDFIPTLRSLQSDGFRVVTVSVPKAEDGVASKMFKTWSWKNIDWIQDISQYADKKTVSPILPPEGDIVTLELSFPSDAVEESKVEAPAEDKLKDGGDSSFTVNGSPKTERKATGAMATTGAKVRAAQTNGSVKRGSKKKKKTNAKRNSTNNGGTQVSKERNQDSVVEAIIGKGGISSTFQMDTDRGTSEVAKQECHKSAETVSVENKTVLRNNRVRKSDLISVDAETQTNDVGEDMKTSSGLNLEGLHKRKGLVSPSLAPRLDENPSYVENLDVGTLPEYSITVERTPGNHIDHIIQNSRERQVQELKSNLVARLSDGSKLSRGGLWMPHSFQIESELDLQFQLSNLRSRIENELKQLKNIRQEVSEEVIQSEEQCNLDRQSRLLKDSLDNGLRKLKQHSWVNEIKFENSTEK